MNQVVTALAREGRPVIYGEVLFDTFPDGSSVMGGAPFNVAWHLQGFGLQPLLISAVGRDAQGEKAVQIMRDWGMDTQGIQIDAVHPTGAVEVNLNNGQPAFTIVPEQAYDFIETAPVRDILHHTAVSLLYHGSLAARSKKSRDTLMSIRMTVNKPVFVDINLRAPWWDRDIVDELLQQACWLKLNDDELARLTSKAGVSQQLPESARILFDQYELELLVLTQGEAGASIISKDGHIDGQPVPVKQIADTVGAGDAFSAVTLLGLIRGWALEDVIQRALQFASMICAVRGATIRDGTIYRNLLKQWRQENDH